MSGSGDAAMRRMDCAQLADAAPELALGILPGDERAAALAHLDECPGCRQRHERSLKVAIASSSFAVSRLVSSSRLAAYSSSVVMYSLSSVSER